MLSGTVRLLTCRLRKVVTVKRTGVAAAVLLLALGVFGPGVAQAGPPDFPGQGCVSVHGTVVHDNDPNGFFTCSSDETSVAVVTNGGQAHADNGSVAVSSNGFTYATEGSHAVGVNNGAAEADAGGSAIGVNGGSWASAFEGHAVSVNTSLTSAFGEDSTAIAVNESCASASAGELLVAVNGEFLGLGCQP